jgi:membrane-associated phospholipid phosphatase
VIRVQASGAGQVFGDSGQALLPVDRLFLVYLGFCWVMIALFMPFNAMKLPRLGVYLLVALSILWLARTSPSPHRPIRLLREWYPVLLQLPLYNEIAIMSRLLTDKWYDRLVIPVEGFLFGGQPSIYLVEKFPQIWLSEWLHFSYFSYIFLVPVLAISLHVLGRVQGFRDTLFLIFLSYFGCYVVFAFFPIEAPNFIFPKIAGPLTEYPGYWLVHTWMQSQVTKGCGLPSSHVAVSATAAWCAYRYVRPLFPVYALLAGFITIATVYGRLHYALDAVAGLAWAVGLGVLGTRWLRPQPRPAPAQA